MKKFTKFCLLLAIFIIAGNWAYAAQVTVTVGTGTNVTSAYESAITPFGTYYHDGQNQMLFTVLELNIAGIGAGDITEIGWEVISASSAMNGFNIEMKHTSATSATSFESGFTNVYSSAHTPATGWNIITLTTPFNWDGTSNLLVKVCFDNTSYSTSSTVYYTSGSYADMNAYAYDDNAAGCSLAYSGTTNRPNTRITGEEFTGMLPPGVPTNPSPVDGETGVAITGDLTWDFGTDTDTYDLWYGPTGSMIQVVTGDNAGATGMYGYVADYNTTYQWQVIAYNSAKGTTNGPVWSFKTKCDVFTAPFSENFDGVTPPALPDCWSKIEITSSGYVQTYANYSYSSPNCVRMRITNQSDKCILITPELSDLTSQSNRITFQGQALTYVQDVIVGTMSDPTDESTFTPYQTITLSLNFYTEYTVNFDANYTLTDKYIAFKDASTYNYRIMTIDDFVYEPMPSCLKPTDLTATNNGITTVDLGGTENNSPPATSWEIEYGDQGFGQGTGTIVIADANPFHLTGLTIDHNYSFYVRTNCGGGDYSAWSDPFDFSTIDGKAVNPDPANNATFVSITAKTFNWDDVIDADSYKIDIGTATGLADIVDDAFCATSDYTYTGADWDYNEDYYWTVTTVYTAKADITGDEWKFNTECDAVSTFPWIEGFENGGAIPSCWSQEYETGTHDWVFQDGDYYGYLSAHTGSYNAAFTHTSSGTVTKLVTPALDLSGLTSPKLTFWHAQVEWGGDQDELRVYYKTSAGGTWTLIPGAVWINNIPNWTEETFTLPSPGSDYYIAFEGTDDYGYGVVVDDVSVYEAQSSIWGGFAKSNDWHTAGNWVDGNIPTGTTDVTIPTGCDNYPTINAPATCNNITFGSDGTNTATLLDNGNLTVNGTATVNRYFSGNDIDWHLVSSPISNATANVFLNMYLQSFDPTASQGPPNYGYTEITNPGTGLDVMEGYGLYSTLGPANTVSFVGNLNTGTYNFNLGYHAVNNPEGWNLTGNPYCSSIDWDLVTIPINMSNEVHYIEAATGNNLSYVQSGVGAERYIPPMQGVFVSVSGPDVLTFDNSVRTHTGAGTFYKSEINDLLVLEATGENYSDKTYIYFNEQAMDEHDGTYDAYKRISLSNPELPQIFSITPSGVYLSINGLPETEMVPVGFTAVESGVFAISAIETSEFANIVLEDLFTQTQTDLLSNSYTFTYTLGDNEARFIIHFTPLAVDENAEDIFGIDSYNKDVYVSVPENTKGDIVIYNMMGQEVTSAPINNTLNKIALEKSAYYVVKVLSEKSVVTKKIFIK